MGTWTNNNYFYKPSHGEEGASYETEMDTGFDAADAALALLMQTQGFKNLRVYNNAVTPASKIDITADAVACLDVGGVSKVIKTFSTTVNCGTTGANGLDTGSLSAGWYFFYVIAKADGTAAGLASTSATSPTLPSGYTFKKLVSAIYYTSGASFNIIRQEDRQLDNYSVAANMIFQIASGSATSANISTAVPTIAKKLNYAWYATDVSAVSVTISWDGSQLYNKQQWNIPAGTVRTVANNYLLNPSAIQTIYLAGSPTGANNTITIVGYELDI